MKVLISLRVKFRAMGITFGSVEKSFQIDRAGKFSEVAVNWLDVTVCYDKQGVKLGYRIG